MKKTTEKKNKQTQGKIPLEFRVLFDSYHKETEKKMDQRATVQDKKRDHEMKKYIAEQNKKSNQEMKKHVTETLKKTAKETQRYIGSISEEHQARTSAVAEQYAGINKKLETNTEMIGTIMEDVAVLKEDVAVLKTDVAEIKEDLKTKADKTEVIHLSRRVSVLEHTS